jgi:hypothetical protein
MMLAFELPVSFIFGFGFLQSGKLGFGEDHAVLSHFDLQGFQAFLLFRDRA